MHPILLHIGSFSLYTYGFFIAVGLLSAIWVSQKIGKPQQVRPQIISDIYFIILLSGIVGGRLLYVMINFKSYSTSLIDIFKIWNGGLVFFGGFITAVIAAAVYLKYKKIEIWKTADIIAPGVALAHAFGRIGCFFAGCCYGKECDLPIAVKFTHPQSLAPLDVYLHPTQLYSVGSNLTLFCILLFLMKRKKFDGMVFLSYIMLYALFRSIIEFFRGDFRGDFIFDFISMSQGIGFVVFIVAFILLNQLSRSSYDKK